MKGNNDNFSIRSRPEKAVYKENPQSGIVITVSSDTAHQIDPDTGAVDCGSRAAKR